MFGSKEPALPCGSNVKAGYLRLILYTPRPIDAAIPTTVRTPQNPGNMMRPSYQNDTLPSDSVRCALFLPRSLRSIPPPGTSSPPGAGRNVDPLVIDESPVTNPESI